MENLKLYQVRRMENGGYLDNIEPSIHLDFEKLAEKLVESCSMYDLKIDMVDENITTINKHVFLKLLNNNDIFWLRKKEIKEKEANTYYEVRRYWNLDHKLNYL